MNLYEHPLLYDLEYDTQTEDVVFYVKQANSVEGPVLELGCGNGRITLPIARSGVHIIGLDNSTTMLNDFRTKLTSEPDSIRTRITLIESDYRQLPQCGPVPLVILPFNALHHCQTHRDVLQLFQSVREQLTPDGRFVLDCYLPDPILYQRDPNGRYAEQTIVDPRTNQTFHSWETSWYDSLEQVHHVTYVYENENAKRWEVNLNLRMFYPQELRALIDLASFQITKEAADFRGAPLCTESLKWVMTLRPT